MGAGVTTRCHESADGNKAGECTLDLAAVSDGATRKSTRRSVPSGSRVFRWTNGPSCGRGA